MIAVAILAAGKGTRMKTDLPKVLQQLCGRSLVERVIEAARSVAPDRQLVIVGHKKEAVESALAELPNLEFVAQIPQLGTGHAIQQLLTPLAGFTGNLVVLTGDTPLLRAETIQNLVDVHKQRNASATVLTALLPDPTGYGRVFCNQDFVIERIIEHKDCTEPQRLNQRISSGVYCFNWQELAIALPKLTSNNAQKEYYLTEVFDYLETVIAVDAADYEESFGINDRLQLARAHQVIQTRTREKWMRSGVTMILPETITIDDTVELDSDVIIEPQSHLRGKTKILSGSTIGPNSFITNSTIGTNCQVVYSVVEDSEIGADCKIGPFARIRAASVVGDRVRIGNFVELKKANVGSKTTAAHLSYLGDVTLGSQVNIGAGTITANYDGFQKHQTIVGDRTKLGSNSVLVAPITIGSNVNVGAGSVITGNVGSNSLAIARSPQVIKPDYYDPQGRKRIQSDPHGQNTSANT
jgi:bifunctional UDP-N-acetylglucosamine pyrophosphorylase / glucosamine-1-phosphate N-acetyltransferase